MRVTIILLLLSLSSKAQMIDNLAVFRMVDAESYARIHYENDFFTATDYYYSQGISAEYVSSALRQSIITKFLVHGDELATAGIAVEHNGFTPTSTDSDSILYGDRPYAATLSLRAFSTSYNSRWKLRMTSSLTLGLIGPAAGGKAMQSTIHQWIDDDQPKGWEHQIHNDIMMNYVMGVEKLLIQIPGVLVVDALGSLQVGTINSKLTTGATFIVGKINPRIFSSLQGGDQASHKGKFSFYGYCQPLVNGVMYDGTLQGGLFNKTSPYTISADHMTRLTGQVNAGVVMQTGPMYLEYFFTFLTAEFNTGLTHTWGGVRVGVRW